VAGSSTYASPRMATKSHPSPRGEVPAWRMPTQSSLGVVRQKAAIQPLPRLPYFTPVSIGLSEAPGPGSYSAHMRGANGMKESHARWGITARPAKGGAFDSHHAVSATVYHPLTTSTFAGERAPEVGPGDYEPLRGHEGKGSRIGEASWTRSDEPAYSMAAKHTIPDEPQLRFRPTDAMERTDARHNEHYGYFSPGPAAYKTRREN